MIANFRKELINFYPPKPHPKGYKVPDMDNVLPLLCNATYKNFWEIDGKNTEQYRITLQIIIPADAPVIEGWRVFYNDNMYTVWQVDPVRHPVSNRLYYQVVHSG